MRQRSIYMGPRSTRLLHGSAAGPRVMQRVTAGCSAASERSGVAGATGVLLPPGRERRRRPPGRGAPWWRAGCGGGSAGWPEGGRGLGEGGVLAAVRVRVEVGAGAGVSWAKRLAVPGSESPARSKTAIDRLIARREVHLRGKTLWRMLYETAGRAEEILGAHIAELGLRQVSLPGQGEGRPCQGLRPGPGARGLRRGDRLLGGRHRPAVAPAAHVRARGPVFVTHRRPGPGKVVSP